MEESDDLEMALGFKIHVESNPEGQSGAKVTVRWLKGHDGVLFESFCGMMKRQIEETMN
jgi:23S rRNA (adenine1618-N6)-methyltransferase